MVQNRAQLLEPFSAIIHSGPACGKPGETIDDDRRIYVESCNEYCEVREGMRIFEKSAFISARWFRLEEEDRPVNALNPKIVPAIALNMGRADGAILAIKAAGDGTMRRGVP